MTSPDRSPQDEVYLASLSQEETLESDTYTCDAKAERRFLWKLDICLLVWAWLAYCLKLVDANNYKTAYASGMKEDLGLHGIELNLLDTFYRVPYAIFLIPSQLILTRIAPNIWLPSLELGWGLCTGLMAYVRDIKSMYVLRVFIGIFESSSYPGIVTILCNWYTPKELALRVSIFGTSYPGASIFVSFMQAALHQNLEGRLGLAGYKWLFIFNAIMTVIVALFGFFFIPYTPGNARIFWLNKEENLIAKARMDRCRKLPPTTVSWAMFRRIFTSWVVYVFTITYCLWSWGQNSNTWIILWLKALKNPDGTARFGISQLNAIPIGGYVLMIVSMLFFSWISDRTGWRCIPIIIQQLTALLGAIILSIWNVSFGVKMWAFYMLWLSNGCGPILVAWMADLTPSAEDRAMIIGIAVVATFAVDSFANVLIYPASEAPHYKVGYKAVCGFAVGCIIMTYVFWYLTERRRNQIPGDNRAVVVSSSEKVETKANQSV